ncbi:MAG: hypothetical protein LQ337_007081 [Flavoplaca oasis]|nr:MAG: hypothetical protein LQ337_007081 [Flavoplaca oasis]
MGFDNCPNDAGFYKQDAPHDAAQRPLEKKKSLTRLFTPSRASSRSRAPSVNDEDDIPSTPTIPEHYHSSSRKASNCESFLITDRDNNRTAQPVLRDVTSTAVVPAGRSDVRTHSFRRILKSKTKVAQSQGNVNDYELFVSPTPQNTTRSHKTSNSYKSKKERLTVQRPSVIPQARKDYHSSVKITNPQSPRNRTRGASAASLSSKNPHTVDPIPQRPSTSGGERGRAGRSLGSGMEDFQGPGLCLSPLVVPSPTIDQDIRDSLRSAMTTTSSILEPSTARSSVLTKESDTTVESPPRDLEDEGMTVDEAIGMYENGFMDDDSDHDICSASSIDEEERRRSKRIAEAINGTIGPLTQSATSPPESGFRKSARVLHGSALRETASRVPPIMPPTVTRDQYGFLKTSRYVDAKHFDTWERAYTPDQFRRAKKWL